MATLTPRTPGLAAGGEGGTIGREGPVVSVRGLVVRYGETPALRGVDLEVEAGETVAVLGPSGSGKTTLLYAIAGFLPLAGGEIRLTGSLAASASLSRPPERRPVAMVFQHYGLWPHMDALETVAYPLRRAGWDARRAREEAADLLDQLKVGHLAHRRPEALSGGEQQRVGLARALARRPALYLLDEPTAHLDTALKSDLRAELGARIRDDGAAAIHATHDVEEALSVADRVVLLRDGSVVQVGAPQEVYSRPADEWAARLTGPVSFLEAGAVHVPVGKLDRAAGTAAPDDRARLLVRPDWLRFDGPLAATVEEVAYRGTHTDYRLATPVGELLLRAPGPPAHAPGSTTSCRLERAWRMPDAP